MEPIFSVVPLNPPIERKGKLYYWGCRNRVSGRIWRQSYRVTQVGAENICFRLNLSAQLNADDPTACDMFGAKRARQIATRH